MQKSMQLKHWPRPQTSMSSYISTVHKYDAGQQLHKCNYVLKFKKNTPVWAFVIFISHDKQ